ncbi:efflux RND transporter periplasmic adaptor subunit [Methylocella sp. CPCC 101449]|uniref:efflux RND transporter periplasmic adaptor subunit n=1 Tax=Methylocella sp. CPCC 101449 TaxID=2987531 RepID=UPI0009630DFE|nr:efflux RND transporter periplasmic adaptor subunit [Methylocella sp. CPCC 101449]MBN9084277.1 efflux RND transporter periplasmic adaptor subunit [Hyphomicrobiales bacterium]MDT2022991.1 efflux RND transporter periplasmic adaptor subunit [Methylocella sp. CPCC 101449]OJY02279.1 MAG: efflux transporter periplasmic adaptor subunit [Rhizobiales bacterium 62-17]
MKRLIVIAVALLAVLVYAHFTRWIQLPSPLGGWLPQRAQQAANSGRGGWGGQSGQPIPVLVTRVKTDDVPVTADAVGTVQALNTVTVRAQVDGQLTEIAFREGQDVKAGDVIARIDPRTYQAQYDQAVAKKAQDEAQLANARLDLERYTRLAQTNFGSKQQADTQRALVAQLEAQVRVDQALIDSAKITLDYTTIRAPVDGRTGIRLVDVGNIVRSSDQTGVVTLTQLRPLSIFFNLPQQQLRALNAAQARAKIVLQALEPDNTTVIETGTVEVIDNQVDQATGTVRIKSQFANPTLRLWPGQFVNVRAFIDVLRGVTVAPSAAIQRGPRGAYVYVLRDDSTVKMTDVTVTRQDEKLAVIEKGVEPGARIVITGFGRLTDEAKVSATADDEVQPAPAAEESQNQQRRRGGRRG